VLQQLENVLQQVENVLQQQPVKAGDVATMA